MTQMVIALMNLAAIGFMTFLFASAPLQTRDQSQTHQQVVDAVQDQRLNHIEQGREFDRIRIDGILLKLDDLTASMNKFTGIGIGFGAALTILQVFQVILQFRRKTGP